MTQWPVKPDNAILSSGVPLEQEWTAGSTGDAILPGDVVEFDTSDCPKIKAGTADATGIIGVADIAPASATTPPRGSSRTVAYAAADQVKVISGASIIVMLRLAASADITCGDHLQSAGSGEVKEYTCASDESCQLLAQSLETIAVNTLVFQWVLARWLK